MIDIPIEPTKPKRDHRNYFMRPMSFTDYNGNAYPDAIYSAVQKDLDIETKTVALVVSIYKSPDDFDLGNPPISERDGGIRRIIYRGVEFDAFIAANAMTIAGNAKLCHETVAAIKNVPNAQTREMESFFKDAGEVILPEAFQ